MLVGIIPPLQGGPRLKSDTQGSAKPTPWAESCNRFAVNPTDSWAVRPRECEIKAISAEGAADIVARILAGNIGKLNLREPPYIHAIWVVLRSTAPSALDRLWGRFPGPNSPGYNPASASRLSYTYIPGKAIFSYIIFTRNKASHKREREQEHDEKRHAPMTMEIQRLWQTKTNEGGDQPG